MFLPDKPLSQPSMVHAHNQLKMTKPKRPLHSLSSSKDITRNVFPCIVFATQQHTTASEFLQSLKFHSYCQEQLLPGTVTARNSYCQEQLLPGTVTVRNSYCCEKLL